MRRKDDIEKEWKKRTLENTINNSSFICMDQSLINKK